MQDAIISGTLFIRWSCITLLSSYLEGLTKQDLGNAAKKKKPNPIHSTATPAEIEENAAPSLLKSTTNTSCRRAQYVPYDIVMRFVFRFY